jgi:hypothetical protein
MNILRRKSSARSNKNGGDGALLADVQECCSASVQVGTEPNDASVNRAMMRLMQTSEKAEVEKAVKFMGQELKADSHRVIMLTLATIGFLMKCDHDEFPRIVSNSSYILKPMMSVIEYKKKPTGRPDLSEQATRALEILQCWGDGLYGRRDTKEILEMYNTLKKKDWITWPERNPLFDLAPLPEGGQDDDLHAREVSIDPDAPPPPRKPASLRPSSLRTFSSRETAFLRKDFDQFDSVLSSLEQELKTCRDSADLHENALVPELVRECDKIGPQLRTMIEIVTRASHEEDALAPLLDMNDRLLRAITTYQSIGATPPQPRVIAATKPVYSPTGSNTYNPFDDEHVLTEIFGEAPKPSYPSVPPPTRAAPQLRVPPVPIRQPPTVPVYQQQQPHNNPFDDDDLL